AALGGGDAHTDGRLGLLHLRGVVVGLARLGLGLRLLRGLLLDLGLLRQVAVGGLRRVLAVLRVVARVGGSLVGGSLVVGAGGGVLLRLLLRGGLLAAPAGGPAGGLAPDDAQLPTDLDGLVLLGDDLAQYAGHRRGDLGVDLVRRDLQQRLVHLDLVALGL